MWDRIGYIFAAKAIQGFVQELMAHDKKSDEPQESNSLTEEERKLVFKKLSELENSVSGTHSYGFSVSRDRSMFMSEVGDSNPQPKEVAIVFDTCFLMQKKGEGRSGKRLWWEHTEEFHKPFEWIQELFPNVVLRLIVPVEVQEEIAKHLNSEDAELSHLARIARGRIIDLKQHEHYEEPSLQDVPAHKSKSVIGADSKKVDLRLISYCKLRSVCENSCGIVPTIFLATNDAGIVLDIVDFNKENDVKINILSKEANYVTLCIGLLKDGWADEFLAKVAHYSPPIFGEDTSMVRQLNDKFG